jgi:hypothetical protein
MKGYLLIGLRNQIDTTFSNINTTVGTTIQKYQYQY